MAIRGANMKVDRRRIVRSAEDESTPLDRFISPAHNRGIPEQSSMGVNMIPILGAVIGVTALLFSSYYYSPAFLSTQQVLGVSGDRLESVAESNLDFMRGRKGYFKAGQPIAVEYALPPAASANLEIKRCGGPIVFEILKCNTAEVLTVTIADKMYGHTELYIGKSGFYHFDVTSINGEIPDTGYSVVWRRG